MLKGIYCNLSVTVTFESHAQYCSCSCLSLTPWVVRFSCREQIFSRSVICTRLKSAHTQFLFRMIILLPNKCWMKWCSGCSICSETRLRCSSGAPLNPQHCVTYPSCTTVCKWAPFKHLMQNIRRWRAGEFSHTNFQWPSVQITSFLLFATFLECGDGMK